MFGYNTFTVRKEEVQNHNLHQYYRRLVNEIETVAVDKVNILYADSEIDIDIFAFNLSLVPMRFDAPVGTPIRVEVRGSTDNYLLSKSIPYSALDYVILYLLSPEQSIVFEMTLKKGHPNDHAKYQKFIYSPTMEESAEIEYVENCYSIEEFQKLF